MGTARKKLSDKKLLRNKTILERYHELKKKKTCRNAIDDLCMEFDLGVSTINNILFVKTYSNSPLVNNDETQTE